MVQRLKLHASKAGDPGSIPDQGTRSYMPQLRFRRLLEILHATRKIKDSVCYS